MTNYIDIGLDAKGNAINGLSNQTTSFQDANSFIAESDNTMITNYNMGTISGNLVKAGTINFNYCQGGTLVLGGTNNVSGVFSLRDSSGTEKIFMDKDGMTINDGKITIKDDSASTIIDAKGLVSTANFTSEEVEQTADVNPNSTTWIDVTGATMSFTLSRTTKIIFLYSAGMGYSSGAGDYIEEYVRLNINGVTTYRPWLVKDIEANVWDMNESVCGHFITSLPAGNYIAKLEAQMLGSGVTGWVTGAKISRINLGS